MPRCRIFLFFQWRPEVGMLGVSFPKLFLINHLCTRVYLQALFLLTVQLRAFPNSGSAMSISEVTSFGHVPSKRQQKHQRRETEQQSRLSTLWGWEFLKQFLDWPWFASWANHSESFWHVIVTKSHQQSYDGWNSAVLSRCGPPNALGFVPWWNCPEVQAGPQLGSSKAI